MAFPFANYYYYYYILLHFSEKKLQNGIGNGLISAPFYHSMCFPIGQHFQSESARPKQKGKGNEAPQKPKPR